MTFIPPNRYFWAGYTTPSPEADFFEIPPEIQPDLDHYTRGPKSTRTNPAVPRRTPKREWFAFKEHPMPTPRKPRVPLEKVIGPTIGDKLDATESPIIVEKVAPKPPKETIRFHVRRLTSGAINITSSLTPNLYPKPELVINALPAKHRKSIREWYRRNANYCPLETMIVTHWGTVTAEEWAESLCSAAIRFSGLSAEAECVTATPVKNIFMAIDQTLYKLSPVAMVGVNRALATVRKRALAEAKLAGEDLLEKATLRARDLESGAQTNANAIYAKARAVQEETNALKASLKNIPPQWLVDSTYPIQWHVTYGWRVILPARLNITQFIYESGSVRRKWAAAPLPHGRQYDIHFYYSAGIGASFSVSNMRSIGVHLPHITTEKSCMQPADAPTALNNAHDIAQLISAVNRTLNSVDLHSMLTHPKYWDTRMWQFVPEDLKKLLETNHCDGWHEALDAFVRPAITVATPAKVAEVRAERAIEVVDHNLESRETWTTK